jgi:hypothetical protein
MDRVAGDMVQFMLTGDEYGDPISPPALRSVAQTIQPPSANAVTSLIELTPSGSSSFTSR